MLRRLTRWLARPKDPDVVWVKYRSRYEVRPESYKVVLAAHWTIEYLSGEERDAFVDEYKAKYRKARMDCEIKNATLLRITAKMEGGGE